MPLNPNSSWAKKYSKEQLTEWGWDAKETGGNWIEARVGEAVSKKFFSDSTKFSLVDSYWKDKLVNQLTKNAQLLTEISQELDFEINEEIPTPSKPNQQSKTDENQLENQQETNQPKLQPKIPGATLASQIPWWVYFLVPFLLWLLFELAKFLLWKRTMKFFLGFIRKPKEKVEEAEPKGDEPKTKKLEKCTCSKTKKGQRKKNTCLCDFCQEKKREKESEKEAVKEIVKPKPLWKRFTFWKYLILTISLLIGSSGGYFWARKKFSSIKPNSNQEQKQDQKTSSEEEIPDQLKELDQEFNRIINQIKQIKVPTPKHFIEPNYSNESESDFETETEPEFEPENPEIIELNLRLANQQAWELEKLEREKAHLLAKRKEKQSLARAKELEQHETIKLDWEKRLRGE